MKPKDTIETNSHLKQNPFGVPKDYFAHLQQGLAQIPQEHPQLKLVWYKKTWVQRFAAAAVLVLAFGIGWISQNGATPSETTLTSEDIIALTESGYLPYSEYDLLVAMDESELEEATENQTNTEYLETTQPDLLEDYYLMNEEI